jgi:3'-phosphoadenosine 5'-phosphosulfate sulfotransferase (PAPS reductase)/FAD synthetase
VTPIPLRLFEPEKMSPFYLPSKYTLSVLNEKRWTACYSGGKDSTSLVVWLEWLRRTGMLKVDNPRLVLADTDTEYPFLVAISDRMIKALEACGWTCEIVRPKRIKKLYVGIFGRGLNPAPPGAMGMRWCTAQTKIFPVKEYVKELGEDVLRLSGMRWGESARRDEKILAGTGAGCKAGGECGLPPPGEGSYLPIVSWCVADVIHWLNGEPPVTEKVNDMLKDLHGPMRELVRVYEPRYGRKGFGFSAQKIETIRFGCIGCPAVTKDKVILRKQMHDPQLAAVNRIYAVWDELRKRYNRLTRPNPAKKYGVAVGPARLEVRKRLFQTVLEIQEQAGIEIVTKKDKKLIEKLWATGNCYTRSWSKEDDPSWGKC